MGRIKPRLEFPSRYESGHPSARQISTSLPFAKYQQVTYTDGQTYLMWPSSRAFTISTTLRTLVELEQAFEYFSERKADTNSPAAAGNVGLKYLRKFPSPYLSTITCYLRRSNVETIYCSPSMRYSASSRPLHSGSSPITQHQKSTKVCDRFAQSSSVFRPCFTFSC